MHIKKSDQLCSISVTNCYPFLISCVSSPVLAESLFFSAAVCKYLNVYHDAKIQITATNENVNSLCKEAYLKNENINLVKCTFLDKTEYVGEDLSVARSICRFFYFSKLNKHQKKSLGESFEFFEFFSDPIALGSTGHWTLFATNLLSLSVAASNTAAAQEGESKINELQNKLKVLSEHLANRDFLVYSKKFGFADLIMYVVLKRMMQSSISRVAFEKCTPVESFVSNVEKVLLATQSNVENSRAPAEQDAGKPRMLDDERKKAAQEGAAQQRRLPQAAQEGAAQQRQLPQAAQEGAAQQRRLPQAAQEDAAQQRQLPQAAQEDAAQQRQLPQAAQEGAAQQRQLPQAAQEGAAQQRRLPQAALGNEKVVDGNENQHANFVRQIVEEDVRTGKHTKIITRFPPEPNGFLHLGHAKSIFLNFGLAQEFNGICNLRFDDTNPTKEEHRYIEAIQEDIKWLGFDWKDNLFYASDYFDKLYGWAIVLIQKQLAYVDDQTLQEIKENRGNIITPGKASPYRDRSVEENLDLFTRMRQGEFEEGSRVLRLKIDMSSPNMNLRDPVIYRILKKTHFRTKDSWNIYPMYDFAHGQSDSIERITHSICTLEFELHRPLYEWIQDKLEIHKTRQIEFARLNCTYMVMSKRKLSILVDEGYVDGWDDPRMPTLSGMRRRGVTPEIIFNFCKKVGVAKRQTTIKIELLESCIRDYMNKEAVRCTAILNPLKVVITNFDKDLEDEVSTLPRKNAIKKDSPYAFLNFKRVCFGHELYIDANDFSENPPSDFYRLSLGKEVRLKDSYVIKCDQVVKDCHGNIVELRCKYNPETKGGRVTLENKHVKGVVQWLHTKHAEQAEIRMYDRLFTKSNPEEEDECVNDFVNNDDVTAKSPNSWKKFINKNSIKVYNGLVEEELLQANKLTQENAEKFAGQELLLQFERIGYFVFDKKNANNEKPIFNLCIGLVDPYRNEELSIAKKNYKIAREKAQADRKAKKELKALPLMLQKLIV